MSFDQLNVINNRAQPNKIMKYKLSLMLYKLYREKIPTHEWLALNYEQTFTFRQTKCFINFTSNFKVTFTLTTKLITEAKYLCNIITLLETAFG
jgi:hypothetical protein